MKDNKNAFPTTKEQAAYFPGMTLRQWYATHAMVALIQKVGAATTNDDGLGTPIMSLERIKKVHKGIARSAFMYADAMIGEDHGFTNVEEEHC